ncbi:hypothetical protein [Roseomonas populi]|uniref:Replication initiator protein A n=1 Tax=Roseomonas populi TaxID=3121582 RepID=A0ABT1XA50_9PROT|nr:hypothetical protein [Roseomonas pecuniae]MCR0984971.1 hypothetical protein [Roseomonas pecuniae]
MAKTPTAPVVGELDAKEAARLARFERTKANRRGRRAPAVLPAKLTRTSAFAPRRKGLVTDSNFVRVYAVRPHSVIEVRGRELGSQHRDAIVALFRTRAARFEIRNPEWREAADFRVPQRVVYYETSTTWRALLQATGRTAHVNNLATLLRSLEELRAVSFRVYAGSFEQYEAGVKRGRLPSAGFSDTLISRISWEGVGLDGRVTVRYGEWLKDVFESKSLVSLDADVYFKLRSDYAKALWPYIDGKPSHSWIDAPDAVALCGEDYAAVTTRRRLKLREELRQAFDDLVTAGGLASWSCEAIGQGRGKTYRYRYVHAKPRQGELILQSTASEP